MESLARRTSPSSSLAVLNFEGLEHCSRPGQGNTFENRRDTALIRLFLDDESKTLAPFSGSSIRLDRASNTEARY